MPSIETSIETALFARMALLVLAPALPVAWPNVAFTPPSPRRYLRVSHLPNTTDRLYQGQKGSHRHQGILQVLVCHPLNSGETAAREIAGTVASHFPAGLKLYSGEAKVKITKRADIASALTTDTEIHIPVSIAYRSFK